MARIATLKLKLGFLEVADFVAKKKFASFEGSDRTIYANRQNY